MWFRIETMPSRKFRIWTEARGMVSIFADVAVVARLKGKAWSFRQGVDELA